MTRKEAIYHGAIAAVLFVYPVACAAQAAMKTCPVDRAQMEREIPCPGPGGALRHVTPENPQPVRFCSICRESWTGVALEAGQDYRIRILADPDSWADGDWQAATAAEALEGWESLSDIPGTRWWEHVVKGPFVWWGARSRRVPQADWFQVFFVVRDGTGADTDPVRLETPDQAFNSPVSGELYFFVNDHPKYYENNNTGRMSLEISLVR